MIRVIIIFWLEEQQKHWYNTSFSSKINVARCIWCSKSSITYVLLLFNTTQMSLIIYILGIKFFDQQQQNTWTFFIKKIIYCLVDWQTCYWSSWIINKFMISRHQKYKNNIRKRVIFYKTKQCLVLNILYRIVIRWTRIYNFMPIHILLSLFYFIDLINER